MNLNFMKRHSNWDENLNANFEAQMVRSETWQNNEYTDNSKVNIQN